MIAITLLTCDRFDYTARTLASLAAQNDLSKFVLLHGDDASTDDRIVPLVRSYGFRTVVQNREREGWLATRRALIRVATKRSEWILNLENDIESLRPFPWAFFNFLRKRSEIVSLRLYGRYKDRGRKDPCLTRHKRTGEEVNWRPFRNAHEKAQIGMIHWSAQPSVTRTAAVWDLHRYGVELEGFTVRVKKNVMAHIGTERTAPPELPAMEATC